jgi:hypothetical protein
MAQSLVAMAVLAALAAMAVTPHTAALFRLLAARVDSAVMAALPESE